jgi:holo-[acyl-carrier protein] synthase
MISIGIDIVKTERIERLYEKYGERFLKKVFTDEEINYSMQRKTFLNHLAARFAAKEAFLKALGTGLSKGISLKEIEVKRGKGAPFLNIYGKAKEILGKRKTEISITHEKDYSICVCVIYKNED